MIKKELESILSEILKPIGFNKKGNYWLANGAELNKIVHLQKSQFSNRYYINYGFIINAIPLNGLTMHVFNGLGSLESSENSRIKDLLDLDNDISFDNRANELRKIITDKIVGEFKEINTEVELLKQLRNQPHLNDIPLTVKRHFHLPE